MEALGGKASIPRLRLSERLTAPPQLVLYLAKGYGPRVLAALQPATSRAFALRLGGAETSYQPAAFAALSG